jgi:WD40 repeat protein/serine/threonine protein kinase
MQKPQNENDQVQAMLAALLQLDASGRERWLREHGGDTAVVSRVLELLSLAGVQGSGPDPDAVTTASAPDEQGRSPGGPTPPAPPGRRGGGGGGAEGAGDWIGPYKLLEIIGEGGFGTVWLAERRQPMVQRVAVKIIKAGMDTRAVVARFEQERQALAVMNHPNIARVFDAGTTDAGRPYFVMEYVAGEPITRYADRQNLTVRQRLELFIPVCEAVQHAHHKGMIHRDIKPSNILVGVSGGQLLVKVIDFGVAKAISHTLTDHSIFTESGQLIGTPEYMSPEQAEMGVTDIDTRTDVYSLGVVLYELLSGLLPFDAKSLRAAGYDAIRKVLREQDAPKPSTRLSSVDDATGAEIALHRVAAREELASELRRELDWIPLKALRKDRTQRYDTPVDLAKDIQRYLDGEVLEAGPEATAYRLKKFLRRNKGPVTAVGAVVLTLGVGLAVTVVLAASLAEQKREADAAKKVAEEAKAIAETKTKEAEVERTNAVAARESIEANAYVANIEMATAAMEFQQFGRVRKRLDSTRDYGHRGWEWGWLNAIADTSLIQLNGHTNGVSSAAFSPDGTRIVTASYDDTAQVWDAATGKPVAQLNGHTADVNSAAFSPDGKMIVTASYDNTALMWDAATGKRLLELKGHTDVVSSAAFSSDGMRIVTSSFDNTARVWDAVTGKCLHQLVGHGAIVSSAAFSTDGGRIVTASFDRTARVWDAVTGKSLAKLDGHTAEVQSAAFSPDGTLIVTTSYDHTARVWDAVTEKCLAELVGHTSTMNSVMFSGDGTRILTASDDNTARVWIVGELKSQAELIGHGGVVRSAVFSADGTRILTESEGGAARVWDAASGMALNELECHANNACFAWFSPDGVRIVTASSDESARVRDVVTGTNLAELNGHTGRVNSAAFSRDGTRIVTASDDKTARVWDVDTGTSLAELKGHNGSVNFAAFSRDSTRVVTAAGDRTARVWDAATGESLAELNGHTDWVYSAEFSPDGTRIVTASRDGTARVWDAATGTSLAELKGHIGSVNFAAISPDGTRIVTASNDNTARVWDAATQRCLVELKGHNGSVNSAAFSPDSTRIVTASRDGTARVWHSVPYRERFKEIQRARAAESKMGPIVGSRLNVGGSADAVRTAFANDTSLTPEERTAAQAVVFTHEVEQRAAARARRAEANALNAAAWNAVRFIPVTSEAAASALVAVRRAIELEPEHDSYLRTLGVALYRAGEFKEALDTLTRSHAINAKVKDGQHHGDIAFIAMAHWQLGHHDQAREALATLRDLTANERWGTNVDRTRHLAEAEALMSGKP